MSDALKITPSFDVVAEKVQAALPTEHRALVLIDGASGTGKTTLAAGLAAVWPSNRSLVTLHMDDFYSGWSGLAAGMALLLEEVMPGLDTDEDTPLRRFDWTKGLYGDGGILPAGVDVIVEGCGSFVVNADRPGSIRLWLEADVALRRHRALSRSGEDFASYWDEWEEQFQNYVVDVDPATTASMRVRSTG